MFDYRPFILLTVFFYSSIATAQKVVSGLPEDLDTEKIVFLEFDNLAVTDDLPKARQRDFNWRNENAKKANNILRVEAEKYPFAYTIASRSELASLAKQGYRYVFENDMMYGYNSGDPMFVSFGKYVDAFYVLDLQNGNKYHLFTISQNYAYRYDYTLDKFIDKVKKKYKSKT